MIPELSIIIPVYNEEARIKDGIERILRFCKSNVKKWEVIVVDDGSTDNTRAIAIEIMKPDNTHWIFESGSTHIITYHPNQGKGYAVGMGISAAQYKWILFTDIDLSTPIEEVQNLFQYTRHYDIVIGSRNLTTSTVEKQGILRRTAGNIFPLLVKHMIKLDIKDTQCGFKLFNKNTTHIFMGLYTKGFTFDVEVLLKAKRLGYRLKEVGIQWKNDKRSKLKLFKDSWRMYKELRRIKILYNIK